MDSKIGAISIIAPEFLRRIELDPTLEHGSLFHWHFSAGVASIAGNIQNISPFVQFQTPFPCNLNEVKVGVTQFDAANVFANEPGRFYFVLYASPLGGGEPLLSSPINMAGPGLSSPLLIRFEGSTFQGENQFPGLSGIKLKPGILYQIDITHLDLVNAANTIGVDVLLTLQKT